VAADFDVRDSFFGDEAFYEADADIEVFGYLVFVEEWVGVPEGELVMVVPFIGGVIGIGFAAALVVRLRH
jgi:hypothetical protein